MTSQFTELNQFVAGDNYVYCAKDQLQREFAYSDGQEVEHRLKWIFSTVNDLSSTSYELQDHITDWPSEYHLTPVRANLLRALNLDGVTRILELGCGCGSITRYLGEQPGVEVDAVEGSAIRAELAALRCRDLPNVTVSTANFNEVSFPDDYYDLVLFVGVTEYAGRFSNAESDEQALQDLLGLAKRTAKPDGAVLVAIENRTGMKYVVGANEDHYAKPYIGIHNYSEPAGIRTYTKDEWHQQIDSAQFDHCEFIYPFPDYKIPTLFLHDDYVSSNPHAYVHLENNRSRDYIEHFKQGSKEALLWEAAVTSGTLGDYANSFMILMSNSEQRLNKLSVCDFVHLPNFQRKLDYCLHIAKPKQQNFIERRYISGAEPTEQSTQFQHQLIEKEPFYAGSMLSVEWARSLICYPDVALFTQYLQQYYAYLCDQDTEQQLSIDLLPSNLVLSHSAINNETSTYQKIDEEWQLKNDWQAQLNPELVYYRAVLLFYCQYPDFIQQQLGSSRKISQPLDTIGDWVYFAFQLIERPISASELAAFFALNDQFQQAISYQYSDIDFDTPLLETANLMILHWHAEQGAYSIDNHLYASGATHHGRQTIQFRLPPANKKLSQLLLHPVDDIKAEHAAFFRLYGLTLKVVSTATGDARTVWQVLDQQVLTDVAILHDLQWQDDGSVPEAHLARGSGLYVCGDDPRVEFVLPKTYQLAAGEQFELTVEVTYPRSADYLLAKDKYLQQLDKVTQQQTSYQDLQHRYQQQTQELTLIKESRSWQYLVQAQLWAARGRRLAQVVPNSLQRIKNDGVSGFANYVQMRLGLTEPNSDLLKPITTGQVFQQWLQARSTRYWQPIVDQSAPLSVMALVLTENRQATDWQRLFTSIKQQTVWQASGCVPSLTLLLVTEDESVFNAAQTALAEITNITVQCLSKKGSSKTHFGNIVTQLSGFAEWQNSDYVTVMTNADYLAPQYLNEYMAPLVSKRKTLLYADDVVLNQNGEVEQPYFKPMYSPDLLDNLNYIGRNCWIKTNLLVQSISEAKLDSFHKHLIKINKIENNVCHISKPVFYRGVSEIDQFDIIAPVIDEQVKPLISIIIPFRDNPQLLTQCLDALLAKTSYQNIEIIGISNDSLSAETHQVMARYAALDARITFHEYNIPFNFAKLINHGVSLSEGEHIVLLNNDIEVLTDDWCQQMLHFSKRDDVAAVGSKLFYPDGRIQHAGIVLGIGSYAAHVNKLTDGQSAGYFKRLETVNNVMAVTGAMMMMQKSVFVELGGLDETRFAVAFNDVDLCLRAWQKGFLNVFTPYAQATHYESVSRGYEDSLNKLQRFEVEKQHFYEKYQHLIAQGDVYYNANLRTDREDYYWELP